MPLISDATRNKRGRPKGALNKTTASTKAALHEAFDKLGGVPALVKWGKNDPTSFYRVWSKLIPQEVTGSDGAPIAIRVIFEGEPPG